ncbi:MAG: hypothetical protein QOH39_3072 [Verrucomicrobiota bacterium]|jgi:hypothetical protein
MRKETGLDSSFRADLGGGDGRLGEAFLLERADADSYVAAPLRWGRFVSRKRRGDTFDFAQCGRRAAATPRTARLLR